MALLNDARTSRSRGSRAAAVSMPRMRCAIAPAGGCAPFRTMAPAASGRFRPGGHAVANVRALRDERARRPERAPTPCARKYRRCAATRTGLAEFLLPARAPDAQPSTDAGSRRDALEPLLALAHGAVDRAAAAAAPGRRRAADRRAAPPVLLQLRDRGLRRRRVRAVRTGRGCGGTDRRARADGRLLRADRLRPGAPRARSGRDGQPPARTTS